MIDTSKRCGRGSDVFGKAKDQDKRSDAVVYTYTSQAGVPPTVSRCQGLASLQLSFSAFSASSTCHTSGPNVALVSSQSLDERVMLRVFLHFDLVEMPRCARMTRDGVLSLGASRA